MSNDNLKIHGRGWFTEPLALLGKPLRWCENGKEPIVDLLG